jgi:hypothetical protein
MAIDKILGRPTLMLGENRQRFDMLIKELGKLCQPKDFFDALEIRELAVNIWESNRFQKMQAQLVVAEYGNAIRKLADPKNGYVTAAKAKNLKAYPLPVVGRDRASLLNELDLSPELVRATSAALTAEIFSMFDRLISTRIVTRKAALKAYNRRQKLSAKAARRAAKAAKEKRLANDNDWLPGKKWPLNNK